MSNAWLVEDLDAEMTGLDAGKLMWALRWIEGWLDEELGAMVGKQVQGPKDVSAGPDDDLEGLARREAEARYNVFWEEIGY